MLCAFSVFFLKILAKLPNSHYMLHKQTNNGNANPTAEAKNDWLTAGFHKLYDIGVQTNGGHS